MASIQLGELVSNIKGSIRGTTYQKNGSGLIMRTRSNPGRTSTPLQQQVHQDHQRRLSEWQALSLDDRLAWNQYAALYLKANKFGVSKKLTGQNWYESTNTSLELIGQPLTSTPPAHDLPISIEPFILTFINGILLITFEAPQDLTSNTLVVWGTPITTRTTLSLNQQRKQLGTTGGAVISELNISAMYQSTLPSDYVNALIAQNKQIVICIQTIHNLSGIASPLQCGFCSINTPSSTAEEPFYYYTY